MHVLIDGAGQQIRAARIYHFTAARVLVPMEYPLDHPLRIDRYASAEFLPLVGNEGIAYCKRFQGLPPS